VAVTGCQTGARLHFDTDHRIPVGDRDQEAGRDVAEAPPEGKNPDVKHAFVKVPRAPKSTPASNLDADLDTDLDTDLDADADAYAYAYAYAYKAFSCDCWKHKRVDIPINTAKTKFIVGVDGAPRIMAIADKGKSETVSDLPMAYVSPVETIRASRPPKRKGPPERPMVPKASQAFRWQLPCLAPVNCTQTGWLLQG
jgi:hypothetical protein